MSLSSVSVVVSSLMLKLYKPPAMQKKANENADSKTTLGNLRLKAKQMIMRDTNDKVVDSVELSMLKRKKPHVFNGSYENLTESMMDGYESSEE